MLNLIDKIGDWNPQLFRELKGRLKKSPVAIALFISLAPQLLILLLQFQTNQNGQVYLNFWQPEEWKLIFISLNMIFIFTLLVAGTYSIVNDLVQEERNGTLNFIRLSPQSEIIIFIGKMLGVPALIHLMIIAAIPFHIFTGISGNIPFGYILCFYLTLIASCIFFYSVGSLFAIFGGSNFRVSKAWFASASILIFLIISISWANFDIHFSNAWFRIFSPIDMSQYLFSNLSQQSISLGFQDLTFFNLPIGNNPISLLALYLVNYALGSYWIFQGLKRCFRNPNATLLSKTQSYLFVTNFNLIHAGFLMYGKSANDQEMPFDMIYLYMCNLLLFIGLIAVILPHRQAIQDWATFRLQKNPNDKALLKNSLLSELITDEKSPATLAMGINLLISATFVIILTLIKGKDFGDVNGLGLALIASICTLFFMNLIMIYTSIAQIILMLKTSKRNSLAIGTIAAVIILPIIAASILSISLSTTYSTDSTLWFFTIFFPYGFVNTTTLSVIVACICQLAIIGLLNWNLFKQVKLAGESATKAMFSHE